MDAPQIHPDLRRAARYLPRGGAGPRSAALARAVQPRLSRRPARGVTVERISGSVTVRMHIAGEPSGRRPALLWIHGGGYVLGAASQDDSLCRAASGDGVVVAAVDYRLAPKHPFPAGLEDCYAALTWVASRPDVDPGRIAIGGASAGGGLAAALALLTRDRAEVHPVAQLLAYPMLDDRTALRTDIDERGFRLWNNKANRYAWRSYTGFEPGDDRVSELAAPARHADLSGVAPAWIGVGTQDLFHDEDVTYADRLHRDGVRCDLEIVPGAFHGFDTVLQRAAVSRAFRATLIAALTSAVG